MSSNRSARIRPCSDRFLEHVSEAAGSWVRRAGSSRYVSRDLSTAEVLCNVHPRILNISVGGDPARGTDQPLNGMKESIFAWTLSHLAGARSIILMAAVIAPLTIVQAQVVENITSFTRTDTGYIIASDAGNLDPDWDRDGMQLRTVVSSFNLTGSGQSTGYTVVYRVLNSLSQPHPIYEASGNTNSGYTYFTVVNPFMVPAHATILRTNLAFIRP